MLDSCFVPIKFDYYQTNNNRAFHDAVVTAGGHRWLIKCYPRGDIEADKGEYVSIYLQLLGKSRSVKAIFEAFLMQRNCAPSSVHADRFLMQRHGGVYPFELGSVQDNIWGFPRFVKRSALETLYLVDGCVTILCGVIVVHDDDRPLLTVPPSDMKDYLGQLLDRAECSDVSLLVGGKKFAAHRAVLAARSPVFKAELFGAMSDSEATVPCITLRDIDPVAFEVLLRFMYTDVLPEDDELDSPVEMYQHLLAAADRYAMDRLKMTCANKLWDNVSVHTVSAVLACAMTYNCVELKTKCIALFVQNEEFKTAVFTDGYVQLCLKFPSILAELRAKALVAHSHP